MHVMAALLLGMGAILLFVKFWRIFVPIAVVGGVVAAVLFGGFLMLVQNDLDRRGVGKPIDPVVAECTSHDHDNEPMSVQITCILEKSQN